MIEWTISYQDAIKPIKCDWRICNSACCRFPFSMFPTKMERNAPCAHLTIKGCDLSFEDRPVTCLLFPFVLTKEDKLILHLDALPQKGIFIPESELKKSAPWTAINWMLACFCMNGEKPGIETHFDSLKWIFGTGPLRLAIDSLLGEKKDVLIFVTNNIHWKIIKEKEKCG